MGKIYTRECNAYNCNVVQFDNSYQEKFGTKKAYTSMNIIDWLTVYTSTSSCKYSMYIEKNQEKNMLDKNQWEV